MKQACASGQASFLPFGCGEAGKHAGNSYAKDSKPEGAPVLLHFPDSRFLNTLPSGRLFGAPGKLFDLRRVSSDSLHNLK